MRNFITYTLTKCNYNDQIKEDEMGRTCSTHERREMHRRFRWKSQEKRDHEEDIHVGGSIMLGWILEKLDMVEGTGLIWLRRRTIEGFYGHSNEPLGSLSVGKSLNG
jgi:hypothetical protein